MISLLSTLKFAKNCAMKITSNLNQKKIQLNIFKFSFLIS